MTTAAALSVAEAIAELKRAGFDARFQCGRVWFEAAGKLYSVNTDYRAEVSRAHVETIIRAAGGPSAAASLTHPPQQAQQMRSGDETWPNRKL
jgi:hypothetical protein